MEAGREALTATFFEAGEALALDHTFAELSRRSRHGEQAIKDFLEVLGSEQILPETQLTRLPAGAAASARALQDSSAAVARLEVEAMKLEQELRARISQVEVEAAAAQAMAKSARKSLSACARAGMLPCSKISSSAAIWTMLGRARFVFGRNISYTRQL